MDVKCEKCQARYRIDDGRVGPAGLTMRCGKCGNTFKVTRGGSTQAVTPGGAASPSAPPKPAASEGAGQTMMFGVAPVLPAKPAPAVTKPPASAAKPAAGEGAGRTMMFGAPQVTPQKAAPATSKLAPTKPAPARPTAPPASNEGAGSTQMFAAAPVVAAKTDASKAAAAGTPSKPAPAPAAASDDDEAGSTQMFAGGPPVTPPSQPKATPQAAPLSAQEHAKVQFQPETPPEPETQPQDDQQAVDEDHAETSAPIAPLSRAEPEFEGGGVVAEGAESNESAQGESLVPARREIPVIPIAIAAATIVIALLALVAYKRFGKQVPAQATIDAVKEAHQTALKDTPADYSAAETAATGALDANARAFFPVGYAELAEIEIAWADALRDKSAPDADIKARRSAANAALNKGLKQDAQNVDLIIAQADYYRSAGSTSSYAKAIKKASSLPASDASVAARLAFVQGLAAAADEEAPEKALPLLKQAAEALKDNARVRFRYAQALVNAKQEEAAVKELNEVLKLSPSHDRAKALLEQEKAKTAPPPPAEDPNKDK